jgi:hemin uptake protein HemP
MPILSVAVEVDVSAPNNTPLYLSAVLISSHNLFRADNHKI